MAPAWYVIMYDIKNTSRLQKLHRFMRTRGYALQKSVFAWRGTPGQLVDLQQQIAQRIRESEDDVRGYRIPARHLIEVWGVHPFCAGVFDARYPPVTHRTQPPELSVSSSLHLTQAGLADSGAMQDDHQDRRIGE